MSPLEIKINLEEILIITDNGDYENLKPKYLIPLADDKTKYSAMCRLRNISKNKFKKDLRNDFEDF